MFKYFEQSTRQEREAMAQKLTDAYQDAQNAENTAFLKLRQNDTAENKNAYTGAKMRLDTIKEIFDIMGIPTD